MTKSETSIKQLRKCLRILFLLGVLTVLVSVFVPENQRLICLGVFLIGWLVIWLQTEYFCYKAMNSGEL